MANTKQLVKRRKAVRNIKKITRTMELIATARFKKALDRASQADAYTKKIAELAADLSATASNVTHPLLTKHPQVKNGVLLILCSNRGLCGGYNAGILREANNMYKQWPRMGITPQLELSGKRAITFFRYQGIKGEHNFTNFEDKPRFDEVEPLADRYIRDYIAGKIDRVDVAWMKFLSASTQKPVVETLLPLQTDSQNADKFADKPPEIDYEFLPAADEILQELLPVSFKVRLFKCFLDAAVSEQIARRVTMKQATENANDMIKSLTSQYNRARQAGITKEILEVISGAEALK
jgi:F-type H+-transporting ATPase subunit gamma